jgi:adenylylsulfate kinase
MKFRETHARSLAKAVSWRLLGSATTTLIVWSFTRRASLSFTVGALEFVTKIGLYWMHERLWERISFGRERNQSAAHVGRSDAGIT